MSIRVMSAVWSIKLGASDKLVLLALADCANDEGEAWPSMATLSAKCSKGERTVQAAIKSLEAAGHLTRLEAVGRGVRYTLHPGGKTPAKTAPHPRRNCAPPPQDLRDTPAETADNPSKNHSSETTSLQNKPAPRPKAKAADAFPCPDGVDPLDWDGLIANRKAKRSANTPAAHRAIVAKLTKWADAGWPPGPIVATAAERGWTSVFPPDELKARPHERNHPHRPDRPAGNAMARAAAAAKAGLAARWQDGDRRPDRPEYRPRLAAAGEYD